MPIFSFSILLSQTTAHRVIVAFDLVAHDIFYYHVQIFTKYTLLLLLFFVCFQLRSFRTIFSHLLYNVTGVIPLPELLSHD